MSRIEWKPAWERCHPWAEAVGEHGVVYLSFGKSAMGHILGYWMGIEKTIYASVDMPEVLHEVVDQINNSLLDCADLICQSPAEVILMGDNFSSDIQSPRFFEEWS